MKVLVVLGSRNPKGQTARAADAFFQGAIAERNEGEQVYLPQMRLELCRQCDDDGWGICSKEGQCVIEDDFALIVDKLRNADAVVFATPVYFSDLSESLRAFLDRLRRICVHETGRDRIEGKAAFGICVAGGGGGGAPACAVNLEKIITICGFNVVDMIPVRRQNLEMKLTTLEATGRWLAKSASSGSNS